MEESGRCKLQEVGVFFRITGRPGRCHEVGDFKLNLTSEDTRKLFQNQKNFRKILTAQPASIYFRFSSNSLQNRRLDLCFSGRGLAWWVSGGIWSLQDLGGWRFLSDGLAGVVRLATSN